jgi:glycosyltransferase involved in cell wall biosynthesis
MRLIILTQYYPPEVGAPQNRLSDLARRFVEMGHEVTVLTAMPNYPAGRIHAGYRGRLYVREQFDGVHVERAWIFASVSRRIPPRLLNYFSFVITSFLVGALRLPRADFILTESPPLFLGWSGVVLAKIKGARFIFNVADVFSDGLLSARIVGDGWVYRATRRLERWLCERAWLVTGQTPSIVSAIQALAPAATVRLLSNGGDFDHCRPDGGDPALLREFGLNGFIVAYAGVHGHSQALEHVVDAAALLTDCPDVVLAFFGDGPVREDLRRRAAHKGLSNVRFFDPVPAERMAQLIPLWSVGLVLVFDTAVGRSARPSKMFELMAAGVPVVLSAPRGDASDIIEAAHAGVCVGPENAAALAGAIRSLYRDPNRAQLGRNGRRHATSHFNRATIARELAAYLESGSERSASSTPEVASRVP